MDKRGGAREGAGRKPKADEIALIQRLSPMDDTALEVLRLKIEEGDMSAIKLFFEYRFGKPKQEVSIDGDINLQIPAPQVFNNAPPLPNSENEVDV